MKRIKRIDHVTWTDVCWLSTEFDKAIAKLSDESKTQDEFDILDQEYITEDVGINLYVHHGQMGFALVSFEFEDDECVDAQAWELCFNYNEGEDTLNILMHVFLESGVTIVSDAETYKQYPPYINEHAGEFPTLLAVSKIVS